MLAGIDISADEVNGRLWQGKARGMKCNSSSSSSGNIERTNRCKLGWNGCLNNKLSRSNEGNSYCGSEARNTENKEAVSKVIQADMRPVLLYYFKF
ncbi:COBRA-like protein [Dirofilaria immitis]